MAENAHSKLMGQRIEQRRKELGFTLQDVSAEVGVAASTIQRYEKGRFDKIKLPVIEAIAAALNVNPAWITGHTDDPTDYDDPELLASIPLSYMELCDGDAKAAYKAMQAVDEENLGPPTVSTTSKDEQQLLSLYRELNDEGREKLIDYADDLVTSGKYIKTDPSGLVQDA